MNASDFDVMALHGFPLAERPPLAVLRYINPAAFAPHHLRQLERLERFAWDGTTALDLAKRIAMGDVWLWEVGDDDEHAIVLTSILGAFDIDPPELWIDGAAGNGIIARADDIIADLRLIAGFYDCGTIGAASARDGFSSLPDKLGFEPVSTIWKLEVGDGRQSTQAADHDTEG